MRNLSISPFNPELRFWATMGGGLGLIWLGHALGAEAVADFLNDRVGSLIEDLGKGRITDAKMFFLQIGSESLQLLSVTVFVSCALRGGYLWVSSGLRAKFLGLFATMLVLVGLNLCVFAARDTTLFWGALYFVYPNLKQSAFHLERTLLAGAPEPNKTVIIGSSQGGSQINSGQLNEIFAGRVRFGNLSYAGALATDFPLILDHVLTTEADTIICYVSEINFYEEISASRFLPLLTLQRIPWAIKLGRKVEGLEPEVWYGVLAATMPIFQLRRAAELAFFGRLAESSIHVPLGKRRLNQESSVSTSKRRGQRVSMNNGLTIEKSEFVRFLKEANEAEIQVIIIQGQINPDVARYMPPPMRSDFEGFLYEVGIKFSNVTLITDQLSSQNAEDYEDTAHIFPHVRRTYTLELSEFLRLHNYQGTSD